MEDKTLAASMHLGPIKYLKLIHYQALLIPAGIISHNRRPILINRKTTKVIKYKDKKAYPLYIQLMKEEHKDSVIIRGDKAIAYIEKNEDNFSRNKNDAIIIGELKLNDRSQLHRYAAGEISEGDNNGDRKDTESESKVSPEFAEKIMQK